MMIKNNNYLVIQGWMINELGLSGNELLAYALVYGFNQDRESEFNGSINYVCGWLNCTRPTAIATMQKLVNRGLVTKEIVHVNGVQFNKYKINDGGSKEILLGVKKFDGGSKEFLLGGSKEFLPNNTNINNTNNRNSILYKHREIFVEKVLEFQDLLGSELSAFIDYWTETDSKGKMRVNDTKYFDVRRRISTWMKNANKYSNKKDVKTFSKFESNVHISKQVSDDIQQQIDNGTFVNPFKII